MRCTLGHTAGWSVMGLGCDHNSRTQAKCPFHLNPTFLKGFPGGSDENLPAMQETRVRSLGREDPLEKEMVAHSSILA